MRFLFRINSQKPALVSEGKFGKPLLMKDTKFCFKKLLIIVYALKKLSIYIPFEDLNCPLCGKEVEDVEQLFIGCKILQSWWFTCNGISFGTSLRNWTFDFTYPPFPPSRWLTKGVEKEFFILTTIIMIEQIW